MRLSSRKGKTLADVPLPLSWVGSERLPKTRKLLKNCWNTGEYTLPRPGIVDLGDQTGVARGGFVYNETLYMVYSNDLLRVDTDGTTTVVGFIAGTGQIDSDVGFNHAVIIVRQADGKGYTFDAAETLSEIVDPDFVPSNSVTHINGRFVYIPFNGDPAFFSDVGAGQTIQTLSFFDAEELPDKNKVAFNFRNVLYIGGTDSFELFRDVGTTPVPFARLNARLQHGYIGGIQEYGNTFAFIGREKDQDVGIYVIDGGNALKISNETIDTILAGYTETELSTAIPGRFKWRGYDLLTYTLYRNSFGFNQGNWFLLDTRDGNENVPWRAGFVTHFNQKYYTSQGSNLGCLDKINTDYGAAFERSIEFGFYNENNDDFTAQSIELGISQGYTDDGTVGLQLSRDNVLYSEPYFRETGKIGEYSDKLVWNYQGGLGYYEGFMGIRLTTTADIEFAADKFTINLR
jgi:hypothetical protein